MYLPASFREDNLELQQQFMRERPLGLLVTSGPTGLLANLVPFLIYSEEGTFGTLRAHIARANPQWKELAAESECLVVFQDAGGYITPNWYATKADTHKVVPTWNYACVQAWGKPRAIEDSAWLRRQIDDLTRMQEQSRPSSWSVDDAPADFVAAQIQAIVGVEIPIKRIEGKWKMSQNRSEADRKGVIEGLAAEGGSSAQLAQTVKTSSSRREAH